MAQVALEDPACSPIIRVDTCPGWIVLTAASGPFCRATLDRRPNVQARAGLDGSVVAAMPLGHFDDGFYRLPASAGCLGQRQPYGGETPSPTFRPR